MSVEERKLLVAMDRVSGIVDIQDDAGGDTGKAIAKKVNHRQAHAGQFSP